MFHPRSSLPALAPAALTAALFLACGGSGSSSGGGGSTGATSSTDGSSSTGVADGCGAKDLLATGILDGKPFTNGYATQSLLGTPTDWNLSLCGGGWFLMASETPMIPDVPADVTGLFRTPASGPLPGTWFCAGQGSTLSLADMTFAQKSKLTALRTLGDCSGKVVSGGVTGCVNTDGDETCPGTQDSQIISTLPGLDFTLDGPVFASNFDESNGALFMLLDKGRLLLQLDSSLSITTGMFQIPAGETDEGSVYCVAGGSVKKEAAANTYSFTLSNLSRVGNCDKAPEDPGNVSIDSQ